MSCRELLGGPFEARRQPAAARKGEERPLERDDGSPTERSGPAHQRTGSSVRFVSLALFLSSCSFIHFV